MSAADVLYFGKSSILLVFHLSMPIILAATVVGLLIALLQTLIQLQEQTLAFACKLTAVVVVFMVSGAWMSAELMQFQDLILTEIAKR